MPYAVKIAKGVGSLFFQSRYPERKELREGKVLGTLIKLLGPLVPEKTGLILMAMKTLIDHKQLNKDGAADFLLREMNKMRLRGNSEDGCPSSLPVLFAQAYDQIKRDPVLSTIKSANPFALSRKDLFLGHYYYSVPEGGGSEKPPIVFLHGSGGNFLFYLWAMRLGFPDRVILFPSWGGSWCEGDLSERIGRIQEMQRDFSDRSGMLVEKPWLFGISNGGIAGFGMVDESMGRTDLFRGMVSIASCPSDEQLPRGFPVFMMNGEEDSSFPLASVWRHYEALLAQGTEVVIKCIERDHFFFLSERETTAREIQQFLRSKES